MAVAALKAAEPEIAPRGAEGHRPRQRRRAQSVAPQPPRQGPQGLIAVGRSIWSIDDDEGSLAGAFCFCGDDRRSLGRCRAVRHAAVCHSATPCPFAQALEFQSVPARHRLAIRAREMNLSDSRPLLEIWNIVLECPLQIIEFVIESQRLGFEPLRQAPRRTIFPALDAVKSSRQSKRLTVAAPKCGWSKMTSLVETSGRFGPRLIR